jgi:type I restriction enzyme S subunit
VLWGRLDLEGVAHIPQEIHANMDASQVKPLDVLLNITGASIGRSCVVPRTITQANVNQHVGL